jgi:hypothetical protein
MQSDGVVIAIISTVITAVVATTIVVAAVVATVVATAVAAAVRAFGGPLLGLLIPNVEVVIISSGGRPRARATIVGVVATPIILRLRVTPPCSLSASCLGCAPTFERA